MNDNDWFKNYIPTYPDEPELSTPKRFTYTPIRETRLPQSSIFNYKLPRKTRVNHPELWDIPTQIPSNEPVIGLPNYNYERTATRYFNLKGNSLIDNKPNYMSYDNHDFKYWARRNKRFARYMTYSSSADEFFPKRAMQGPHLPPKTFNIAIGPDHRPSIEGFKPGSSISYVDELESYNRLYQTKAILEDYQGLESWTQIDRGESISEAEYRLALSKNADAKNFGLEIGTNGDRRYHLLDKDLKLSYSEIEPDLIDGKVNVLTNKSSLEFDRINKYYAQTQIADRPKIDALQKAINLSSKNGKLNNIDLEEIYKISGVKDLLKFAETEKPTQLEILQRIAGVLENGLKYRHYRFNLEGSLYAKEAKEANVYFDIQKAFKTFWTTQSKVKQTRSTFFEQMIELSNDQFDHLRNLNANIDRMAETGDVSLITKEQFMKAQEQLLGESSLGVDDKLNRLQEYHEQTIADWESTLLKASKERGELRDASPYNAYRQHIGDALTKKTIIDGVSYLEPAELQSAKGQAQVLSKWQQVAKDKVGVYFEGNILPWDIVEKDGRIIATEQGIQATGDNLEFIIEKPKNLKKLLKSLNETNQLRTLDAFKDISPNALALDKSKGSKLVQLNLIADEELEKSLRDGFDDTIKRLRDRNLSEYKKSLELNNINMATVEESFMKGFSKVSGSRSKAPTKLLDLLHLKAPWALNHEVEDTLQTAYLTMITTIRNKPDLNLTVGTKNLKDINQLGKLTDSIFEKGLEDDFVSNLYKEIFHNTGNVRDAAELSMARMIHETIQSHGTPVLENDATIKYIFNKITEGVKSKGYSFNMTANRYHHLLKHDNEKFDMSEVDIDTEDYFGDDEFLEKGTPKDTHYESGYDRVNESDNIINSLLDSKTDEDLFTLFAKDGKLTLKPADAREAVELAKIISAPGFRAQMKLIGKDNVYTTDTFKVRDNQLHFANSNGQWQSYYDTSTTKEVYTPGKTQVLDMPRQINNAPIEESVNTFIQDEVYRDLGAGFDDLTKMTPIERMKVNPSTIIGSMDLVNQGHQMVGVDFETTGFVKPKVAMANQDAWIHPTEIALQYRHLENGVLQNDGQLSMMIKPSDAMQSHLNDLDKLDLAKDEDQWFMRNIAKYAPDKKADWANKDLKLNKDLLDQLKTDAKAGISHLTENAKYTLPEAMYELDTALKDNVLVGANFAKADWPWYELFKHRVNTEGKAIIDIDDLVNTRRQQSNQAMDAFVTSASVDIPEAEARFIAEKVFARGKVFTNKNTKLLSDDLRKSLTEISTMGRRNNYLSQVVNQLAQGNVEKAKALKGPNRAGPIKKEIVDAINERTGLTKTAGYLDTQIMSRWLNQDERHHDLASVIKRETGSVLTGAHEAMNDVQGMMDATDSLVNKFMAKFKHEKVQPGDWFAKLSVQYDNVPLGTYQVGDDGVYEVKPKIKGHKSTYAMDLLAPEDPLNKEAKRRKYTIQGKSKSEIQAKLNKNYLYGSKEEAEQFADYLTWDHARRQSEKLNNYDEIMRTKRHIAMAKKSPIDSTEFGGIYEDLEVKAAQERFQSKYDIKTGDLTNLGLVDQVEQDFRNGKPVTLQDKALAVNAHRFDPEYGIYQSQTHLSHNQLQNLSNMEELMNSDEMTFRETTHRKVRALEESRVINRDEAAEIIANMNAEIKANGSRPKTKVHGVVDLGQIGRTESSKTMMGSLLDIQGEEFSMAAATPKQASQGIWSIAGDLSKQYIDRGIDEGTALRYALRRQVMPALRKRFDLKSNKVDTLAKQISQMVMNGEVKNLKTGETVDPFVMADDLTKPVTLNKDTTWDQINERLFKDINANITDLQKTRVEQSMSILDSNLPLYTRSVTDYGDIDSHLPMQGDGTASKYLKDLDDTLSTVLDKDLHTRNWEKARDAAYNLRSTIYNGAPIADAHAESLRIDAAVKSGHYSPEFSTEVGNFDKASTEMQRQLYGDMTYLGQGEYSGSKLSELPRTYMQKVIEDPTYKYSSIKNAIQRYVNLTPDGPDNKGAVQRRYVPEPITRRLREEIGISQEELEAGFRNGNKRDRQIVAEAIAKVNRPLVETMKDGLNHPKGLISNTISDLTRGSFRMPEFHMPERTGIIGLGIGAVALAGLVLKNSIRQDKNTPGSRPNGEVPTGDSNYIPPPPSPPQQPVAHVETKGEGLDGYHIKVSAKNSVGVSNDHIGNTISRGMQESTGVAQVNINSKDDHQAFSMDFVRNMFTNLI